MQISKKRKFGADGIFKAELNELHAGKLLSTLGQRRVCGRSAERTGCGGL